MFERPSTLRRFVADNRIFLLLGAVYAGMWLASPLFMTLRNQATILKGMSFGLPAAVGFTLVMICGHLDLTIGVNLTLGGVLAIGLQPRLGWTGAVAAALACGALAGLVSGLLVTRARIDSFIATLGVMTITQGLIYIYCRGNTVSSADFAAGHWMDAALPLAPPRVLAAAALVLIFEFLLRRTRPGRNLCLIGGNRLTAWTSGVAVDRHVIGAFIVSGVLACLGGALFSIALSSATPTQGNASLMEVIAAVIIGGTVMSGGKGSVFKSGVALLTLTALYNGLGCLGASGEIHKIAGGAVLGAVVLYDAAVAARRRRRQGARHELLAELTAVKSRRKAHSVLPSFPAESRRDDPMSAPPFKVGSHAPDSQSPVGTAQIPFNSNEYDPDFDTDAERSEAMERTKAGNALAIVVVGVIGCVAIVAIFAMYFLSLQQRAAPAAPAFTATSSTLDAGHSTPDKSPNPQKAAAQPRPPTMAEEEATVAALRSEDGQPLILPDQTAPAPPRPAELPAAEDDALHWYDMEYAGWNVAKVNIPKSPGTGPRGKRVIFLKATDHPYHTALTRGMLKVAAVYGIDVEIKTADGTPPRQNQQVDQAINEKPDLVIVSPVEAKASVSMLMRMNEAGIPVIAINLLPERAGHQFLLAWTGPNDWGQFRMLARKFAELMPRGGKYCIVQHYPGWSPFFARTWAVTTELKKIRPDLACLDMQTTGLEAERTRGVVAGWLTQFGKELSGIVSCDDSGAQVGINQAIQEAGREDVIRIAAGNSKVGMDFVKEGRLYAITYQSPEADGAIPMKLAADWFYGKPVPAIRYLPLHIITKEDVERFMPAQW